MKLPNTLPTTGQLVSVAEWDSGYLLEAFKPLGDPATVLRVRKTKTGWMVKVRGASGREETLHASWLSKWSRLKRGGERSRP